jgi:hypothetical protein
LALKLHHIPWIHLKSKGKNVKTVPVFN